MAVRSVFTPSHSALDAIFAAGTTYTIPSYQRPYSWQCLGKSDRTSQVNQMWDDLWGFFSRMQTKGSSEADKEYFLGSMVVISKGDRQFEVIDGQQRLTTLTLLFAAMRCFLDRDVKTSDSAFEDFRRAALQTVNSILFNQRGVGLAREQKVKIERASGFNFDAVLKRALECESPSVVVEKEDKEAAVVASRYYENRNFFQRKLQERFLEDGVFTESCANSFDQFFRFLNTRVSIVLITTTDFETAYFIFETLNNRGLPLSARDLLRNFLIKELAEAREPDPPRLWVDLESNNTLTEDFIGRWVESTRGAQQQTSAFNEVGEIYREMPVPPGQSRARYFYGLLKSDLDRYSMIAEPDERITNSRICNKVKFIRAMGNERYSVNLILAAFRSRDYQGGEDPGLLELLTTFQRWMLYVLLAPGVRFSNANVYGAIQALLKKDIARAQAAFALSESQCAALMAAIDGPILDNDTARLLLAGVVWNQERRVAEVDVVDQQLRYEQATLEHILPQVPAAGSRWVSDFTEAERATLTWRLGNMTLLTRKLNSAARNEDFTKKKMHYQKVWFWLTRDLATMGEWTPAALLERQGRLVGILKDELGL